MNKIFLFLIILIIQISIFNSTSFSDESVDSDDNTEINENNTENDENNEETRVNLDEEELPAIDPFQSSSAGTSASPDGVATKEDLGMLSGLKLVGVIIGEKKKIAILSSNDGYAINFEENDKINENIELQEIYTDHLLIKDNEEKFYEVYMNDIIRSVEG